MKRLMPFLLLFTSLGSYAQIISKFTWDANPVTQATVGPNAISVSTSATSSVNGVGGTNGLNPGTPTQKVDLTLTGSPYFDIPAIDISVDFRKEESQASFYMRNPNFDFGETGSNLYVKFMVTVGASKVTVNSGSVYAIPNDHLFHTYRFNYDDNTGVANLWVDGAIVYTYNGTAGRPLYWTGAGNVEIGSNIDANGKNISVLDNMIIQNPDLAATLPVKLLSFTAAAANNNAVLDWTTSQEMNTAGFTAERSADGKTFAAIKNIPAKGGYNTITSYQCIDSAAAMPVSYYRLKMINTDSSFSWSPVQMVRFGAAKAAISCFPNPFTNVVNLSMDNNQAASYTCTISTPDGKKILSSLVRVSEGPQTIPISLSGIPVKGVLIIQLFNNSTQTGQSFKILRK